MKNDTGAGFESLTVAGSGIRADELDASLLVGNSSAITASAIGASDAHADFRWSCCHFDRLPGFVEAELDRLYENIQSTYACMRAHATGTVNAWVCRSNHAICDVLLFQQRGRRVNVLNEMAYIDSSSLQAFAQHLFARDPKLELISFRAIEAGAGSIAFPNQKYRCSEDITIALPCSAQAYFDSLGKSTRRTIKSAINRLYKTFPDFQHEVIEGHLASEALIRQVFDFNRARMEGKGKRTAYDEAYIRRTLVLVQRYGLIGIGRIEGKICVAQITYRVGRHFTMQVSAHDPAFDDYRLGFIACYLAIIDCIERGGHSCHLLWGRYGYKYSLGGIDRPLHAVWIYRSRLAQIKQAMTVSRASWHALQRKLRNWALYEAAHGRGWGARLVTHLVTAWRERRKEKT